MKVWAVTYAIDSLDPSPMVMSFDTEQEAHDWVSREVSQRVQYTVDHHPYSLDERERADIEEMEWSLVKISETVRVRSGPGPASCAQEWWG
mgnify:FL=1